MDIYGTEIKGAVKPTTIKIKLGALPLRISAHERLNLPLFCHITNARLCVYLNALRYRPHKIFYQYQFQAVLNYRHYNVSTRLLSPVLALLFAYNCHI